MSISDDLMWRYYDLLSDADSEKIARLREQVTAQIEHPMNVKKALARELVERFHGPEAARWAQEYFEARYQKRSVPANVRKQFSSPDRIGICQLIVDLQFAESKSQAKRLIAQGAVRVDGEVVREINFEFQRERHRIIEVGKNRIAQAQTRNSVPKKEQVS